MRVFQVAVHGTGTVKMPLDICGIVTSAFGIPVSVEAVATIVLMFTARLHITESSDG